jgi:hypothetical protein
MNFLVGSTAKMEDEVSKEQKIQDLSAALYKLPRVHLHVLDALIKHLKQSVFFLKKKFARLFLFDAISTVLSSPLQSKN